MQPSQSYRLKSCELFWRSFCMTCLEKRVWASVKQMKWKFLWCLSANISRWSTSKFLQLREGSRKHGHLQHRGKIGRKIITYISSFDSAMSYKASPTTAAFCFISRAIVTQLSVLYWNAEFTADPLRYKLLNPELHAANRAHLSFWRVLQWLQFLPV